MRADVIGRVHNTHLAKSHSLLPLFETLINSIDAIEDSAVNIQDGTISVYILREHELDFQTEETSEGISGTIFGFEVHDNGIGFTEENYRAFNEADTRYKLSRGGKGVGRFLWLKAFEKVEISSVYSADGALSKRSFTFSLANSDGITNHNLEDVSDDQAIQTVVRLVDYKADFRELVPKKAATIARHILEHCLEYFVLGNVPTILVFDEEGTEPINLDDLYDDLVAENSPSTFVVDGIEFSIVHFLLNATSGLSHHLCYCANRRVVLRDDRIRYKIPNLAPVIRSDESQTELVYAGYVSSAFLDERVNQQRTNFNISANGRGLFQEPGLADIEEAALRETRTILEQYTNHVKVEKEERIREFVIKKAPEYRHILKNYPDKLDSIPPDYSEEKIDAQLHEIDRGIERELRDEVEQILETESSFDLDIPIEDQVERLSKIWQEWNDLGKSRLAKYVVHRRYVLDFLDQALQWDEGRRYSLEDVIHELIFPMKNTSDEIAFNDHNLWILDERLVYHRYLSSDIPLSQVDELDSESQSRPDILLFFDHAIAVVEDDAPYTSGVVIFEFKRPMRDGYSSDKNPIQQVLGYVEEIKAGKKVDKNGRPLNIGEGTPFYCYVIADLTPSLHKQAKLANLQRTPDNSGYFGYFLEYGAYIEVLDFNKVLMDSMRRNRILFDMLNMKPD